MPRANGWLSVINKGETMNYSKWHLPDDRFFDPNPAQQRVARKLYGSVADLPVLATFPIRRIWRGRLWCINSGLDFVSDSATGWQQTQIQTA